MEKLTLRAAPASEVLAAGWALTRVAQLVGAAPVLDKALVALGVSQANRCEYDVRAWLGVLRLLGRPELADAIERGEPPADARLAALLHWARATAGPVPPTTAPGEPLAEYVGTALCSHFINRMVLAMLPPRPAPIQDRMPGASLPLLAGLPTGVAPGWGDGTPAGKAYAALAVVAAQGARLLTPEARDVVRDVIAGHRGRLTDRLRLALPARDRRYARIAILAGLAPATITVEAPVHLVAYGAMTAVRHIEADVTVAAYPAG